MATSAAHAVLTPHGPIDVQTAERLEGEVHALRRSGYQEVVLDLRRVSFLDSYGLQILLALRNAAARDGFRLRLVPGPTHVQRLFELTATRTLFDWAA